MSQSNRTVLIISGNPAVTEQCIMDIALLGKHYDVITEPIACDALKGLPATKPAVVFLDESAILDLKRGESLSLMAVSFSKVAPVVVAAPH